MAGSTEEYSVKAFVYGYDDIRLEFDIAFNLPADLDSKEKQEAAKDRVGLILPDLKFCYPMTCVHCGMSSV
ncbi:hypothetical protein EWM64_g7802 [Hericium alpestre]|uniref:Uncharacterized protein n=1 Tax=Hericium alpestre TaxID=135208 RepID=A0A4Y9ZPN2_9AGAM|nr:hypothetical protein EWM64_g7802 [Hericium alpestre]